MAIDLAGHRKKMNTSKLSLRFLVPVILLVCALTYLVFAQGGYYGASVCFAGVLVWLGFAVGCPWRLARLEWASLAVPLLLFVLAAWYLASTLAVSPTATSVLESGKWFAVAGAAFLALVQTPDARKTTLRLIACLGLVTAVFGLLVFSGVITFEDALYQGRLQSTFQYANAAAVWFGVSGILCFAVPGALRSFSPACFVAMLLCQSGGAVVSFVLVLIICALVAKAKGVVRSGLVGDISLVVAASILGTFFILLMPSGLQMVAVLLLLVLCLFRAMGVLRAPDALLLRWRVTPALFRCLAWAFAFAFIALVVSAAVLFWGRIQQATGTFAMRLVYDMDSLSALASSPLFGLGPDMWRFLYPQFQSAQYSAALVHCGYLQVAVDAGVPAFCLLVAAIVLGVRRLLRAGPSHLAELSCVLLVATHSLVDFDLSFGVIAMLLAYLLVLPEEGALQKGVVVAKADRRFGWGFRIVASFCFVAGVGLCSLASGVYSDVQSLARDQAEGDYVQVVQDFKSHQGGSAQDHLVSNDLAAQEVFLDACLASGRYGGIRQFCVNPGVSTSAQALSVFEGLCLAGDKEFAMETLVGQLEKEPYNYEFYKKAWKLIDRLGLQGDESAQFESAVSVANQAALGQNPLYPKAPKLL